MASNSVLKDKRKIVEEPAKEEDMWIFVDTECRVDKKVLHMEFIIPSIPGQRVSSPTIG
jgi:hypothetical protein